MAARFGFAAASVALVGLAYINGRGPPGGDGLGPALLQTITKAGVALALGFLIAIFGIWCLRQLWAERLAWRPGRIEVDTFVAAADLADVDAQRLTMLFRQRLAVLHLSAPTPTPAAAAGSDFLDVLGGGMDTRNIVGSALTMLRAAKPRYAWQVNGVLERRDEAPAYGVTVQVIRVPDEGNPPERVWAKSWEEAVRRAADRATAAILPRTRLCRTPWSTWRGFVMPSDLVEAYERAADLEGERRYDEALNAYYEASGKDPLNLPLRLHIGQLQEKMGLFLDALNTYQGIRGIRGRQKGKGALKYRRGARREQRRTELIADYRRAVLLGGTELAKQWRKTGSAQRWSARDARRTELRRRLKPELDKDLSRVWRGNEGERTIRSENLLDEPPVPAAAGIADLAADKAEQDCLLELREALALLALEDLRGMHKFAERLVPDRLVLLSPQSVKLTELCVDELLRHTQQALGPGKGEKTRCADNLRAEVLKLEGRGFNRWQEHYNAACVYSIPLLIRTLMDGHGGLAGDPEQDDDFAGLAVERLELAASCADSAYIAGRREWLLTEDPDLTGLRKHPRFTTFEARYFPSGKATPERPRYAARLVNSEYVSQLLINTAQRWEKLWHDRGAKSNGHLDVHALLEWWDVERDAWRLVHKVARNHRNWSSRLELINQMDSWGHQYRFEPLKVSFTPYAKLQERVGVPEEGMIDLADERLVGVEDHVPRRDARGDARLRALDRWEATLRELDASGRRPGRMRITALCDQHAALWQRFREWVAAEGDQIEPRFQAFMAQLTRTTALCGREHARWRTHTLFVTLAYRANAVLWTRGG